MTLQDRKITTWNNKSINLACHVTSFRFEFDLDLFNKSYYRSLSDICRTFVVNYLKLVFSFQNFVPEFWLYQRFYNKSRVWPWKSRDGLGTMWLVYILIQILKSAAIESSKETVYTFKQLVSHHVTHNPNDEFRFTWNRREWTKDIISCINGSDTINNFWLGSHRFLPLIMNASFF